MTPPRPKHVTTGAPAASLSKVVNRFATPSKELAAERSTLPRSARARLDRLLQEIDETILPRRLRVSCENAPYVELTVSNRRLVVVRKNGSAGASLKSSRSLSAEFAAQLLDLSKQAKTVSRAPEPQPLRAKQMEQSCTVETLRRTLGLDAAKESIDDLKERLDRFADARLWWDMNKKKIQFKGDEDWKAFLRRFAADIRQTDCLPANSLAHASRQVSGLAVPLNDKDLLISAFDGHKGYVCIAPRTAAFEALSAWQITAAKP